MSQEITVASSEQMMNLGATIGARLRGGECIELSSDVGGGKTTFTRGLAKGAGSEDHVSSPTFTVSKVYRADALTIVHFDFYRLHEPGDIEHELAEVIEDPRSVIVVEWSDVVAHVLPDERLRIEIVATHNDERRLTLHCPDTLAYLVEGLV